MKDRSRGRIITFYSYKGGTGRSMALANIAWILATRGERVVMLDWDFEAPGLHRYFHPFLKDKNLVSTDGLLDLFRKFEQAAAFPVSQKETGEEDPDWYRSYTNITPYAVPLEWSFEGGGTLEFVHAGRQTESYAVQVNSFNWANFYDRLGGGVFLEALKEDLRLKYDYILIDSRTGVSDTAGICTVQLPDTVVSCFTYNLQSIEGASAVTASIRRQRSQAVGKQPSSFRIFPVAMRVEQSELERLERMRQIAQNAFAGFLDHLPAADQDSYWGRSEIPYVPFYAYQEILAAVGDRPGRPQTLLAACERLAGFLTNGSVMDAAPLPEIARDQLFRSFLSVNERLANTSPAAFSEQTRKLADEFFALQKTWTEAGRRSEFLLRSDKIEYLQRQPELQLVLMEDGVYREFWQASIADADRKSRLAFSTFRLASLVILVVLLALVWTNVQAFDTTLPRNVIASLGGILGAFVSTTTNPFRVVGHGRMFVRATWLQTIYGALIGGMSGVLLLKVFDSHLLGGLGFADTSPTVSPTVLLVLSFLAGYSSVRLLPSPVSNLTEKAVGKFSN
jgi:MinD-like ATPase involved in chromosome partitioning or flagellar assembly